MPEYFLSELERLLLEQRARASFVAEPQRDGYLRLFNKNAHTTTHVRIVEKCPDRYGWIVECDEVPEYFRRVLTPEARGA